MTSREQEFTQIIKDHEGVIFKITTLYTDTEDEQKDLYQDIVYQLWKSFEAFRGDAKISTWMYRVALNTALTKLKKEKRSGNKVSIDHIILKQTEQYDIQFEEKLATMYSLIKRLNDLEKGLILLVLEEKKYEEIAIITGLTVSNVGTRISRIKQKLKTQIKKD